MKSTLSSLLLALAVGLGTPGCQSDPSDDAIRLSAQSRVDEELAEQKRELEAEKEELRAEKARLTAEKMQRAVAARAKLEEENRTYPQDAVAGIWNVRMKCTESDCDGRSAGDVLTEIWNVAYTQGEYQISVANTNAAGGRTTNSEYRGGFDGKTLQATYAREASNGIFSDPVRGARIKVRMRMKDENTLVGKREMVSDYPCLISYQITATRMN